jgi:hypothetical protein
VEAWRLDFYIDVVEWLEMQNTLIKRKKPHWYALLGVLELERALINGVSQKRC